MQCGQFEETITDYLDGGLTTPVRRRFCEHLLACRLCHQTFNDVRAALDACQELKASQPAASGQLQQRIIAATTAGEMMSCRTLDALISDYFDGLIENGYEAIFNEHFAGCESCRRLVEGVRQSDQSEIEVPDELYERIFAATSRAIAS